MVTLLGREENTTPFIHELQSELATMVYLLQACERFFEELDFDHWPPALDSRIKFAIAEYKDVDLQEAKDTFENEFNAEVEKEFEAAV